MAARIDADQKPLNPTEQKHCIARLEEVYRLKCSEIREKHTTKVSLTAKDKLRLMKKGSVYLDDRWQATQKWTEKTLLIDAFDFRNEESETVDTKKIEAEQKPLRKAYNEALDAVRLSLRKEALEKFEAFVKGY